mmetsp:Transcript_70046/g.104229  ORF Transcript_70046/g.104229 Transcript_70046/m.104229 type:complete len:82 (+) Transcript_70046:610-855(+)
MTPKTEKRGDSPAAALAATGRNMAAAAPNWAMASRREFSASMATEVRPLLEAIGAKAEAEATRAARTASFIFSFFIVQTKV